MSCGTPRDGERRTVHERQMNEDRTVAVLLCAVLAKLSKLVDDSAGEYIWWFTAVAMVFIYTFGWAP